MRVSFWIPGALTSLTGGQSHVTVQTAGSTLGEALNALFAAYPGMRDRVFTEQGTVREHVNVFVGSKEARLADGPATSVVDGTEISIIPAISGG